MKIQLAAMVKRRTEAGFGFGPGVRAWRAGFLLVCVSAVLLLLASCGSGGRDAGGAGEVDGSLSDVVVAEGEVHEEDDEHEAEEHEADEPEEAEEHEDGDEHEADEQEADEHEAEEHEDGDDHDADEHESTELSFSEDAERGLDVYRTVGCSACHGQDGEGTALAPALANHTPEQVRTQVRSPRTGSIMPAFDEALLGDEDLGSVIAFITSLEGEGHEHLHAEEAVSTEVVEMHHWMAISAVKAGNGDEARHHVGHIIEAVEGDHLAAMEAVLGFIEAGDMHSAEHDIEEMLASAAEFTTDMHELHLQLALQSVELGKAEEAEHHLVHFADLADGDAEAAIALAGADAAASGDLDEAERVIHELMEMTESEGDHDDDHAEPEGEEAGDAEAEDDEQHAHAEDEPEHTD